MAAITLSSCTLYRQFSGEFEQILVVTPATADSADTINLAGLLEGRTIRGLSAWDSTTGDSVTCTLSTSTITLDAAGGTTDHVYNVVVVLR
jgi:hypothetical protein